MELRRLIESVLRQFPASRDSDEIVLYYVAQKKGLNPDSVTLRSYLQKTKDGELPRIETITRWRRKIQEEIPNLRGNAYNRRHDKSTSMKANRDPHVLE